MNSAWGEKYRPTWRILLAVICCACAAASLHLFTLALLSFEDTACTQSVLVLHCVLPPRFDYGVKEEWVMLLLAILGGFALWRYRGAVIVPLASINLALLGICALHDVIFDRAVIDISNLVSETYNALTAILLLSFGFTISTVRMTPRVIAVAPFLFLLSFAVRDFSFAAFFLLERHYTGAVGMYFLFAIFSFGCFTPHIMTIVQILRLSANPLEHARLPQTE